MTTLQHDCRERQPIHDRIEKEVADWLAANHAIEVIPQGVCTGSVDYFNRIYQESKDGLE